MISELGFGIATSTFGLAVNEFWKRALHIYIYKFILVFVLDCRHLTALISSNDKL